MVGRDNPHWDPLPAVAQGIASGEPWIIAWALQSTTPYRLLSRESGISEQRLDDLYRGASVSHAEIAALAKVWRIGIDQVMLTLPAGTLAA